jgi:tetratricopeptide (TPR) repeat protein
MYDLERLLEELLETDASPGALHLVLSKIRGRGRAGLVVQQCRKALILHPDRDDLRTLLAEAYLEQGLATHASEELMRVTRRLDEAAGAYKLLADALARQGRDAEAAGCLECYLAHRPDDAEARQTLARLRPPAPETGAESAAPEGTRAGEEAFQETPAFEEEAPVEEPIPEIATPTLAELYYSQGQIDAAVETYERILARSPDDPRANARLRELLALRAAPEEAPAFEEAAPERAPDEELGAGSGPASVEESALLAAERRTSRRMIAVLEEWLTRIHETGTNAST